jgi:uncharacterized membrane protein
MIEIERRKMDFTGKALVAVNLVIMMLAWVYVSFYYPSLPDTVPTHFDLSGRVSGYGHKSTLLLPPIILTIAVVLILLTVKYRFTLINRYPYLVNLPAFAMVLASPTISPESKADFINRIFNISLLILLGVNATNTLIVHTMFYGATFGILPPHTLLAIIMPVLIVVAVSFYLYYRLYHQIKSVTSSNRTC